MPVYRTLRTADAYGYCVGILLQDYHCAFIPGDVGNATTYDYPVLYRSVPGAIGARLLRGDPELETDVIEAAKDLEAQGVKGISSDCGFFMNYQDAVAAAVKVPVFLSSLLQIPFVSTFLGKHLAIGVITADSTALTNRLLSESGVDGNRKIVVHGLQDEPEFKTNLLGEGDTLDTDKIESETVNAARRMQEENPDLGAIVMECSMLPPYSKSVQAATGLPVYDFINMIDYFQRGTHQKDYHGYY